MKNLQTMILTFCILAVSTGFVRLQSKLQERSKFKNQDFVYDLNGSKPTTNGLAGTGRSLNVEQLPSLKGEGVSMVIFHIQPCGINLPHIHPRGTELFYVVEGTFKTAFIEENSGRTIVNTLTVGQATFFPQGLIHEEQNIGCENATFISAFSSEDAGVLTVSNRLFTLPEEALLSTFDINKNKLESISSNLPTNPAAGDKECLKRCAKISKQGRNFFQRK